MPWVDCKAAQLDNLVKNCLPLLSGPHDEALASIALMHSLHSAAIVEQDKRLGQESRMPRQKMERGGQGSRLESVTLLESLLLSSTRNMLCAVDCAAHALSLSEVAHLAGRAGSWTGGLLDSPGSGWTR